MLYYLLNTSDKTFEFKTCRLRNFCSNFKSVRRKDFKLYFVFFERDYNNNIVDVWIFSFNLVFVIEMFLN